MKESTVIPMVAVRHDGTTFEVCWGPGYAAEGPFKLIIGGPKHRPRCLRDVTLYVHAHFGSPAKPVPSPFNLPAAEQLQYLTYVGVDAEATLLLWEMSGAAVDYTGVSTDE